MGWVTREKGLGDGHRSGALIRAIAAAIVVLAGCSEATGPNIDGIEVTLSLSQDNMAVGDTIEIRVLATNTTANPVSFFTHGCVFRTRFLDQSNALVGTLPYFCNSMSSSATLAPGESLERIIQFDGRAVELLGGELFTLESGTYAVFAGVSSISSDLELLNPSNAVELRIVGDG